MKVAFHYGIALARYQIPERQWCLYYLVVKYWHYI